ncbi:MAG: hypothetical protein M3R07_06085 [Gemmatimonadota bacterium]|nr:hypothetical protein [Gemmatimonadota bacterium]
MSIRLVAAAAIAVACSGGTAHARNNEPLEQARAAARADRNAEAAKLFAGYLGAHPDERRAILREFADQLIYSGRADAAVPLLREVLTWELSNDERLQAQRSYALALLWSDQHRQAIAAYDALLAGSPGDEDATFNRIRGVQWLGRPDVATQMLGQRPAELRANPRAAEIEADIRKSARPVTGATVGGFDQADGLDVRTWRLEQQLFTRSGAAWFAPYYQRSRFDQGSAGQVTVDAPGIAGHSRVNDWLQMSGRAGLERHRGAGLRRSIGVYEASVALLPADNLRLDFVTARRSLDNLRSLQMGITTRHYFGSIDYWPDSLLKLTLRGESTHFADGNDRQWAQIEAERRLSREPHIFVGARATAFRFDEQFDHGYFNPKSFRSVALTARGSSTIAQRTWVDLAGSAGPEDSTPGGTKLAYWLRGRLSHGLTENVELSLAAERLSSQGLSSTGFARTSISGSIALKW